MNLWDIVIALAVLAAVLMAVRKCVRDRRSGKSCLSCGENCAACGHACAAGRPADGKK